MKKLFLLIPLFAFALMTKAKESTISPGTANILRTTVSACTDEDNLIILNDDNAVFDNTGNYIAISHNLTIQAAEGKHPVIKPQVPIQISGGATVKFIGVKFDGSILTSSSYDYLIRFNDDNAGNALEFDNCEFTEISKACIKVKESGKKAKSCVIKNCIFTNNSNYLFFNNGGTIDDLQIKDSEISGNGEMAIYSTSGAHTGSCLIDKCYFHDYAKAVAKIDETTTTNLSVTNSTFANIDLSAISAAVIDSKTADGEVVIDYCTFYNCPISSSSYGTIKCLSSNATVTNNIFALSASTNIRAIHMPDGREVKNCLTYNYTYDGGGIRYGVTITNCLENKNPLFKDAANNDFTLRGASPARGAGLGGSNMGDSKWSKVIRPATSFDEPLVLEGIDASLNSYYSWDANYYIKSANPETVTTEYGVATWQIHANGPVAVQATLNMYSGSLYGHTYKVEIYDSTEEKIGEVAETGWSDAKTDVVLNGSIYLPAAGDYTVKLLNICNSSVATIKGITLSYFGGATQNIAGTFDINEAWFTSKGSRADGMITFSSYSDQWVKWNAATTGSVQQMYAVSLNISSPTTYGHRFSVSIYEDGHEAEAIVLTESSWNSTYGTPLAIPMGNITLDGGKNYVVKVTNAESGAQPKIVSVSFVYVGGAVQNIPGTLTAAEAMFSGKGSRADGMISFTAYLGEWVKWNVATTGSGTQDYNVTLNISNPTEYGHNFSVSIYEAGHEAEAIVVSEHEWNQSYNATEPLALALGKISITGGKNYIVKVTNAENGEKPKVISVAFVYAGGAMQNIPGTIALSEAILSTRAFVDGTGLHFTDNDHLGSISGEYAKWNIHAAEGVYKLTALCTSTNYSNLTIKVLDSEENEIYSFTPQYTYKQTDKEISSPNWLLLEGDYVLKLSNPANNSNGYVTSLVASEVENSIVLDESETTMDIINPANGSSKIAALKRTFRPGVYNSICVPFNVSSTSEMTNIFGTGYELLEMTSAALEEAGILTLNFATPASNIQYGRPYLIKPTKEVVNPLFNSHTIQNSTSHLTVSGDAANLVGVLCKQDLGTHPENLYLGADGNLYFSNSDVTIKGFRAYFHVNAPNPQQAVKRARIVTPNNMPTEIELVGAESTKAQKVLREGLLIIIKNGVQYNVQGQIIK